MVSTRKIGLNLGETVKKTKFTPPSLMKATPTKIGSDQDDICQLSFSDADDVMLMSPSQSEYVHNSYSTPTTTNSPEGRTTAVVAMMRGKPKDGSH